MSDATTNSISSTTTTEEMTNATAITTEAVTNATTAFTEAINNVTTTAATSVTDFMSSTESDFLDNDQENDLYNITYLVLAGLGIAIIGVSIAYCTLRNMCKKVGNNGTELDAAFYSTELDNSVQNIVAGESNDVEHNHCD